VNWLDLFIVLFLITALIRGTEIGFIRQFFSTFGFFAGLFLGAWINSQVIHLTSSPNSRALLSVLITLGLALAFMTLGEYLGMMLKFRLRNARLTNKLDKIFGSVLAVVTLLAAIWLGAAIFRGLPDSGWQRQISTSRIVTFLDNSLPSAPDLLTRLGYLLDPNSFPRVFSGLEPDLKTDAPLPDMGELNEAVQAARPSVVKIEGEGCNKLVEGSGFVSGPGEVITNAHVVAGVKDPFVLDQNGRHEADTIYFDPNLDLAILKTSGLAGKPLVLEADLVDDGTASAVLGYPSGAGFTAGPGAILDHFTAVGRNIYNQGETERQVYSIKTNIREGSSGGPAINVEGEVVGVIFAKSINYTGVGYALTMDQILRAIDKAREQDKPMSTSACT
jgi:S1-C subfamily serine protease